MNLKGGKLSPCCESPTRPMKQQNYLNSVVFLEKLPYSTAFTMRQDVGLTVRAGNTVWRTLGGHGSDGLYLVQIHLEPLITSSGLWFPSIFRPCIFFSWPWTDGVNKKGNLTQFLTLIGNESLCLITNHTDWVPALPFQHFKWVLAKRFVSSHMWLASLVESLIFNPAEQTAIWPPSSNFNLELWLKRGVGLSRARIAEGGREKNTGAREELKIIL